MLTLFCDGKSASVVESLDGFGPFDAVLADADAAPGPAILGTGPRAQGGGSFLSTRCRKGVALSSWRDGHCAILDDYLKPEN